jgi:hypothetical protein
LIRAERASPAKAEQQQAKAHRAVPLAAVRLLARFTSKRMPRCARSVTNVGFDAT